MNERIQELYDSIVGNDKLNFDSYLAEKFAESLIRQCMDLVKDCYAESGRSLYQSVCASTIIEEHFGVEE
jgi:hypothetical protein